MPDSSGLLSLQLRTAQALISPDRAGSDPFNKALVDNFVFPPSRSSLAVRPLHAVAPAGTEPVLHTPARTTR